MKKTFMILAVISLFAQSALAADLSADVVIENDGSAKIEEIWQGVFSEGDEICIPIDLSDMYLSDFTVSDQEGKFEYVSDWEALTTFEEKSRKCGIVRSGGGTKLCFGISSYGEKSYTVSYILDHFAKGYNECDVSDFVFIEPSAELYPTNAVLRFSLGSGKTFEKGDSAFWVFGCGAAVGYDDGSVNVTTKKSLSGNEYLRVMLSIENGTINPSVYLEEPFENKKNAVFEETGYSEKSEPPLWAAAAAAAVIAAIAVISVLKGKREKK